MTLDQSTGLVKGIVGVVTHTFALNDDGSIRESAIAHDEWGSYCLSANFSAAANRNLRLTSP